MLFRSVARVYHRIAHQDYPPFLIGEMYDLLAEVTSLEDGGAELRAWIDWQEVMRISIAPDLLEGVVGHPGIRADNGKYEFRYFLADT